MANKIPIHRGDVGDSYEPSGSEEEYTEREKHLLQKVRKGRRRDTDPEQELMAFQQNDDDDDEEGEGDDDYDDYDDGGKSILTKYSSLDLEQWNYFEFYPFHMTDNDFDNEDADPTDGIPDARAWGKKRRDFYSTDFVDQDYSSYNAREEELAEQEENEARSIQQRLAKQLDEADFSLDVFTVDSATKAKADKKDKSDDTYLKKDLSTLSQRQKEQLFKKESPEFNGLVQDFKQRMAESVDVLEPTLAYFRENTIEAHPLVDFVSNLNQLILNYCTNVSFYLVLKAKRIPIKNHPIVKRLVQIRQLLLQLEEKYASTVKPQLDHLLMNIREGKEFTISAATEADTVVKKPTQKKFRFIQSIENGAVDKDDNVENGQVDESDDDEKKFQQKLTLAQADSDEEEANNGENGDEGEGEGNEDSERREITYQIAKNKGLTPYRKKELRNPRVKHRNKFRKALIRRKGAVRTVRKEIKRYDGEKFGIKASVKKGIKIK